MHFFECGSSGSASPSCFLPASTATLAAELHYVARIMHIVLVVQFRRGRMHTHSNTNTNGILLFNDALILEVLSLILNFKNVLVFVNHLFDINFLNFNINFMLIISTNSTFCNWNYLTMNDNILIFNYHFHCLEVFRL